jgi:hypothetical protein
VLFAEAAIRLQSSNNTSTKVNELPCDILIQPVVVAAVPKSKYTSCAHKT